MRTTNLIIAGTMWFRALMVQRCGCKGRRTGRQSRYNRSRSCPRNRGFHMEGYAVMPMARPHIGDIFVSVTGCSNSFGPRYYESKGRAILANAGHFDVEIDTKAPKNFQQRFSGEAQHLGLQAQNSRQSILSQRKACKPGCGGRICRDYGYELCNSGARLSIS